MKDQHHKYQFTLLSNLAISLNTNYTLTNSSYEKIMSIYEHRLNFRDTDTDLNFLKNDVASRGFYLWSLININADHSFDLFLFDNNSYYAYKIKDMNIFFNYGWASNHLNDDDTDYFYNCRIYLSKPNIPNYKDLKLDESTLTNDILLDILMSNIEVIKVIPYNTINKIIKNFNLKNKSHELKEIYNVS